MMMIIIIMMTTATTSTGNALKWTFLSFNPPHFVSDKDNYIDSHKDDEICTSKVVHFLVDGLLFHLF